MTAISVSNHAIWPINRSFELRFSHPVDFATVSSNTVRIVSESDVPATGSFELRHVDSDGDGFPETVDAHTVVFRPSCPTRADLSDAGLKPGGEAYTLTIVGVNQGTTNTVRSVDGRLLAETQRVEFTTPSSFDPSVLFLDPKLGPPSPVVRGKGSALSEGVTYVEIGGDPRPDARVFFELDPATQIVSPVPGPLAPAALPLNLYSDPHTRTAVVVAFDQPVGTSETNLSSRRLRLEFQEAGGAWIPIETRVELLTNCSASGATVRLAPVGILPADSLLRAIVRPGFVDLSGEAVLVQVDDFAVAPTDRLDYASLFDPDDGADEFLERFDHGGDQALSFEDTDALFDSPVALWKDGRLSAAFDFDGRGGPGGNFDWVIRSGQVLTFDTIATDIIGGPDGVPTRVQQSRGGLVDVRSLVVHQGGVLRIQGPNPFLINATGEVRIDGRIDLSGFDAKTVATLNTGHQPESGGAGAAGGGPGGNASEVTTNSTPRGGDGGGPFGERDTGGQGGESGYAPNNLGKDARRPGGGGGGRFAADFVTSPSPIVGFVAETGYPGHENSRGAETRARPALGGKIGTGPFRDQSEDNDFLGTRAVFEPDGVGGSRLVGLIRGELARVWAGYGGGGGGDALPSNRFPTPRWSPSSDEKGGGGGGGAGALRIRALGRIVFGTVGVIIASGGEGATGENANGTDHVGGTGGSGSGGHVLLESAVGVDFVDGDTGELPQDSTVHVLARGGRTVVGLKSPGINVPCGVSHGGAGGPGVIQIHVPSLKPPGDDPSTTDILISSTHADSPSENGLLYPYTRPPAIQLIPTFGARSQARSKWISLGGADRNPDGGRDLVHFLFGGTDTATGEVLRKNTTVLELEPILGPVPFPTADVELMGDGMTLRISGAALDPLRNPAGPVPLDLYLRTPALLREFRLRVDDATNPAVAFDFDVVTAYYDDASAALELVVFSPAGTILDATEGEDGFEVSLAPRFFRIVTDERPDFLPTSALVRMSFDAAAADPLGNPDDENLLFQGATDIRAFDALAPGALGFFRFHVEFDLDAAGTGIAPGTKPVELEFLRLPFTF